MRTIFTFFAVLSLLLAISPDLPGRCLAESPDQAIDLRPRFVEGRTARYRVWTLRQRSLTMSIDQRSATRNDQAVFEGELTWQVEQVEDNGSATCLMSLDWLTAKLTAHDGTEKFNDSRQPSGDLEKMHQLILAMVSSPVRVTVAADGSVTGVSGVEAIRQQLPESVSSPDDLDFVETASDLATIPFAPPELALGDSFDAQFNWSHDLMMSKVTAMMRHEGTYTLASVEDVAGIPIATVEGSASLNLNVDLSALPADGPPVDVRLLSGESTSQMMFDLWRHEVVGRNVVQTTQIEAVTTSNSRTIARTIDETVQSQALRIAEQ